MERINQATPAPPLASCLYEGWVRHRRVAPAHRFRYRLFMLALDLSEVDRVFRDQPLWSARRPNLAYYQRSDFLDPHVPDLADAARARAERSLGERPDGRVVLLSHPRYFGVSFNPVSFYYCYQGCGADERLAAVVSEITNTPWGERHSYVVDCRKTRRRVFDKRFHVSPFMPMDLSYDWRFSVPGEQLTVQMLLRRQGQRVFDATLALSRRPIPPGGLWRLLLRFPLLSAQVLAAIYWQAWKLRRIGAPFHSHPRTAAVTR